MPRPSEFLPTASLGVLKLRGEMLQWLREFFRKHGYWEVQTPILSHDVCVDAWLEPFCVPLPGSVEQPPRRSYLQTSPEFAMKRLIAAGADAIFQIGPVFRQGESGPLHNPEFTMVEWYRVGDRYDGQMEFVEQLAAEFVTAAAGRPLADPGLSVEAPAPASALCRGFPRLTYREAFEQALRCDVLTASSARFRELADRFVVTPPASLSTDDRDGWLNLLLSEVVQPRLAEYPAVFLYDYPASQSALARIRPDDPPVAERFELYLRGLEICNGYQELTDADELRRRIRVQSSLRESAGLPKLPADSRLLEAMDAGLPECAGVAMGFDRLLMAALGCSTISDVLPFPFDRA